MRRLSRRQQRILKRKLKYLAVDAACGLGCVAVIVGLFIAWTNEPTTDFSGYIEENHVGMVEVSDGVWLASEDYAEMNEEREAYQESEVEAEQAAFDAVLESETAETVPVVTGSSIALENTVESAEINTEESMDISDEDAYRLCKIAMAEAEGEDTEGKALVMLVILNRVASGRFPDTIWEVITADGQFTSYRNGRYDRVEPSEDCWAALDLIQDEGWDGSCGATYFERATSEATWHSANLKTLFTHGHHTFYIEKEGETN